MNLNNHIENLTKDVLKELENSIGTIKDQISKQVINDVARQIAQIDFTQAVRTAVVDLVKGKIEGFEFPDGSIPGPAVNLETFKISGDNVEGGIIKKFGSTGIQDDATDCRVTVLDELTAISNKLVAAEAEVKGDLVIDGQLVLNGEVNPDSAFIEDLVALSSGRVALNLNETFFAKYSDLVFELIKQNGIDLNKITIGGKPLIEGNQLGTFVTDTNIQKLGELRQLMVKGEASIANTFYTGVKRVGINTMDPSGALAVWDEETEVVTKKLQKDTAFFGTIRNQRIVLSSNNQHNLVLEPDGSATVKRLNIGALELTSSPVPPTHDARRGVIVLNENVDVGKPLLWVSLGGARWSAITLN